MHVMGTAAMLKLLLIIVYMLFQPSWQLLYWGKVFSHAECTVQLLLDWGGLQEHCYQALQMMTSLFEYVLVGETCCRLTSSSS